MTPSVYISIFERVLRNFVLICCLFYGLGIRGSSAIDCRVILAEQHWPVRNEDLAPVFFSNGSDGPSIATANMAWWRFLGSQNRRINFWSLADGSVGHSETLTTRGLLGTMRVFLPGENSLLPYAQEIVRRLQAKSHRVLLVRPGSNSFHNFLTTISKDRSSRVHITSWSKDYTEKTSLDTTRGAKRKDFVFSSNGVYVAFFGENNHLSICNLQEGNCKPTTINRYGKTVAWHLTDNGLVLIGSQGPGYQRNLLKGATYALPSWTYQENKITAGESKIIAIQTSSLSAQEGQVAIATSSKTGHKIWVIPEWEFSSPGTSNAKLISEIPVAVSSLGFSIDGNLLAFGTDGGHIQLWEIGGTSYRKIVELHDTTSPVRQLTFSPGQHGYLVSTHADRKIRIWNISTAQATTISLD